MNTGDVLAIVSYPGYDNNKMANSIDAEYYAKLNADKSNPQYNYAAQYAAAPGSTFKMLAASAGLMEGVIDVRSVSNCKEPLWRSTRRPDAGEDGDTEMRH